VKLVLALCALAAMSPQAAKPAISDSGWAQWRGPNRDGISPDTGLLKQWPSGGPPLAWKASGIGTGYSSVSFAGDRLFTMGELDGRGKLLALNLADGKILWSADVGGPGGNRGAGPRSTPATDGKLVIGLGQQGDLVCVNAADGKEVWRKSLPRDFGGRMMSGWGFSESPLLDGDLVVCTPGGSRGTLLALKKESGQTVWQCAEVQDRAAYSSVVPVEIGGVRQYVLLTDSTVAGVAAKDGKLCWRAPRRGETAVVDTPIYHDGIVFVSSAYRVGCNAFSVTAAGGQFKAEQIYSGQQFSSHHGGAIRVGDHVYGLGDGRMKCVELKTGKLVWENRGVGKGSIAYADGHFVCRGEGGPVALVEATPAGYREKGRFDLPKSGGDAAWPHPVIFGGRLYIRDWELLHCYDVKAK
jgi:hypothetical protein